MIPSAHTAESHPSWQMIVSLRVVAPFLPFFRKELFTSILNEEKLSTPLDSVLHEGKKTERDEKP